MTWQLVHRFTDATGHPEAGSAVISYAGPRITADNESWSNTSSMRFTADAGLSATVLSASELPAGWLVYLRVETSSHKYPTVALTPQADATVPVLLSALLTDGQWPADESTIPSLVATQLRTDLDALAATVAAGGGGGGTASWSTLTGKPAVIAAGADAAAARAVIGAGTSSLAIGTTSTTAKAGDYAPAWGEVTGKPTTFAPVIGATAADAVAGNDARLSDARTPISHMHPASQVSDSTTVGRAVMVAADAASARAALGISAASRLAALSSRLLPPTTLAIPPIAPSGDIPTVTTSGSATVTGGQHIGAHSGIMTEIGARGDWSPIFERLSATGLSGFDFYLSGTVVEFHAFPNVSGSCPLWIWVNGSPVTATPSSVSTSPGTDIYVKLTFGTSARRRIEFFFPHGGAWYSTSADFATVITPAPRKPVVAFVGDSFWGGSDACPEFLSGSFLISRMLGVECFNKSVGGSGYVAGGANTFGGTDRVSAVAAANPELIVIQGSVNDDGSSGIQDAATAAFSAYATACPTAKIIVFGPEPSNATDTISANRAANIAAVKAAAIAAPNVLAFHDMVGSAAGVPPTWTSTAYNDGDLVTAVGSVWRFSNGGSSGGQSNPATATAGSWVLETYAYSGTGNSGSTVGDGSRDTLLYSDGVHPLPEANAVFAIREASIIRDDLRSGSL